MKIHLKTNYPEYPLVVEKATYHPSLKA